MPGAFRRQRVVALLIAVLTALALTMTVAVAPPADAATKRERKIGNALQIVRNQKGDPYRYGAEGPRRFDCSGLLYYAYRRAGIRMPRTSGAQADRGRRIRRRNMRKGDLMVFHNRGDVYHIAVYTGWTKRGKRRLIHAPYGGKRVRSRGVWTNNWYPVTLRRR